MEEVTYAKAFVRVVAPWLVNITAACSVLLVLFGTVRALVQFLSSAVSTHGRDGPPINVQLNLGRAVDPWRKGEEWYRPRLGRAD